MKKRTKQKLFVVTYGYFIALLTFLTVWFTSWAIDDKIHNAAPFVPVFIALIIFMAMIGSVIFKNIGRNQQWNVGL